MAYQKINPIKQFDFQINRILTYGEQACNFDEVKAVGANIRNFDEWHTAWRSLGDKAEKENRELHSAYYYRLAEFFLKESPEKETMQQKSLQHFNQVITKEKILTRADVPYQNATMKTLYHKEPNAKSNIVVFGGYDSFIEEFYLAVKEMIGKGHNIYIFEGCGQGETLKQGIPFEPHWEKPLSAVLDYFNLNDVTVIGISWGGYLALRAAAFEKRVKKAVAYDVLYDGFDCMTNTLPKPKRRIFKILFALKAKGIINKLAKKQMQKEMIADWAISHGQYITQTKTPFDFYSHLKQHTLKGIENNITCDVLLLAGEKDHYIPKSHYRKLLPKLTNAKSVTGKVFTEIEGGQEHCQIGNHRIATNYIFDWLKD